MNEYALVLPSFTLPKAMAAPGCSSFRPTHIKAINGETTSRASAPVALVSHLSARLNSSVGPLGDDACLCPLPDPFHPVPKLK